MAFGFPAYYTEQYSAETDKSADLHVAIMNTLNALSWSVREEGHGRIIASTSMNMSSWGEKVLIIYVPSSSISITSKCVWPLQCFDWGKNKTNVKGFLTELRTHV